MNDQRDEVITQLEQARRAAAAWKQAAKMERGSRRFWAHSYRILANENAELRARVEALETEKQERVAFFRKQARDEPVWEIGVDNERSDSTRDAA